MHTDTDRQAWLEIRQSSTRYTYTINKDSKAVWRKMEKVSVKRRVLDSRCKAGQADYGRLN